MSETKKTRTPRQKSSIETELHAAKRVGDMLSALSPAAKLRVISLVREHLVEDAARPAAPVQTVPAAPTASMNGRAHVDANGTPVLAEAL